MSQTTIVASNTVDGICVRASSSADGEGYYLTLRGDGSASKPSHPVTYTSQDEPQKTSSKDTLTKTRNWMAQIFPWQTVKALFDNTLRKTGDFMARLFSLQNVENTAIFYEDKSNDAGTACKTAGRNIYKRATAPKDVIKSTADAITPYGRNFSTKSWVAKKAKAAVRTAVIAVRILGATAHMCLNAALGAVEAAGAGALYALDALCEEE